MGSGFKKSGIAKQNTQKRVDHEIDRHFAEESYMEGFEKNLEKLDSIYRKCLKNYIDAIALYPDNAKLQDLKLKYAYFFKMFEESRTKSLYSAHCSGSNSSLCTEEDNKRYVPSYSDGLTQMSPKKLCYSSTGSTEKIDGRMMNKTVEIGEHKETATNDVGGEREGKTFRKYNEIYARKNTAQVIV